MEIFPGECRCPGKTPTGAHAATSCDKNCSFHSYESDVITLSLNTPDDKIRKLLCPHEGETCHIDKDTSILTNVMLTLDWADADAAPKAFATQAGNINLRNQGPTPAVVHVLTDYYHRTNDEDDFYNKNPMVKYLALPKLGNEPFEIPFNLKYNDGRAGQTVPYNVYFPPKTQEKWGCPITNDDFVSTLAGYMKCQNLPPQYRSNPKCMFPDTVRESVCTGGTLSKDLKPEARLSTYMHADCESLCTFESAPKTNAPTKEFFCQNTEDATAKDSKECFVMGFSDPYHVWYNGTTKTNLFVNKKNEVVGSLLPAETFEVETQLSTYETEPTQFATVTTTVLH